MTAELKRLEVFQDLLLHGPATRLTALREALLNHTASPWRHAAETEKKLSNSAGIEGDTLAFERKQDDALPAATLWLLSRDGGYKVTNIVPREHGELGYAGYNAILQDFERRIASPAAREAGFRVETTASHQSIDDWLSPEAAKALRLFSRAANKSTGSSHPLDRERWFHFLIAAYRENDRLHVDDLFRWLSEIEGWDEKNANSLAIEYEFGLALLREYDRPRP